MAMANEGFGAVGYERMEDEDGATSPPSGQQPSTGQQPPTQQHQQQMAQPMLVQATTAQGQPSQTIMVQPNQPIILNYRKPSKPRIRKNYKATIAVPLGYIQIACGILDIILQIIAFVANDLKREKYHSYDDADAYSVWFGIWCGMFVILNGSFAVVAGKSRHIGFIITSMVISIFAALFSIVIIGLAAWAVDHDRNTTPYWNSWRYRQTTPPDSYREEILHKQDQMIQTSLAMGAFLLLSAVVSLTCAVFTSSLACAVSCCCVGLDDDEMTGGQVMYLTTGAAPGATPGVVQMPQAVNPGVVQMPPTVQNIPAGQAITGVPQGGAMSSPSPDYEANPQTKVPLP